ncbi:MAG TPA: ferritin-like domain-containing protein [bacterium]|nr:ferritin-like domain-containing protein [bacterium]HNT65585.1 ferritin-like domain-containing protein [bacterium]HOX87358.1 ferritin-like domain-containing protein [bacterium]HPG46819.1 ferritin-like domain-containing protein [bacterium]HPM99201.1 ferritin-like domain-containing protein [bacterium]
MSMYHEPPEELSPQARDISRALNSLKEEIEAIDWYNQRVDRTGDESLKKVLAHNRDEEIEHACMALEWLRRNMGVWDEQLRLYLFSSGDLTELEEGEAESTSSSSTDLGIGKL